MAGKAKIIKPTALKWFSETINWEVFQRISLHLYRMVYDDPFAEEYLQRGMFQDGIDIISFKKDSGKSSTIQCKFFLKLQLAELKAIVELFLASEFVKTSDVFIITTTANLQETAIKKYIFEQIAYFKEVHQIQFDCWDVGRLEAELKHQYLLVEHYFGVYEADRYCFEPRFRKINYNSVDGFIGRNLKDFKAREETDIWSFGDRKVPKISLTSLLTSNDQKNRLIGIIAEAYEGKSTLFQQTAYELFNTPDTVPLLLDMKGCNIQPIDDLLTIQFNTWKSIPAKNLVLLIDGLDEVATDQLLEAIGHINDFGTKHPSIRISVSCRKLYYANYNLDSLLSQFTFYELIEIHYGQIIRYADSKTGEKGETFYQEMDKKGISLLLANPFYLIKLVGWYTDPKENIPDTKIEIAVKLVEESFNISGTRKPGGGKQLSHYKGRLKKLLQQLALAFQINGINSCSDELIQELFAQDDITILTHSSVLNIEKGKWMFINAFFQEQLAAMAMLLYNVDDIISLITVGEQIKKIKTKWIQTISTYLSMLGKDDPGRDKLLNVIEEDNIELIAKSEGSKFDPAFKLNILEKIIGRSIQLQSRLVLINEHELAAFIGNDRNAVDYLLNTIQSETACITKVICCYVLKSIRLNVQQVQEYTAIAKLELLKATDRYYARLLLEGISHYKTGDENFLKELLEKTTLSKQHEFRQGVYKFFTAHHLVEVFYDFVLEGLDILYYHNASITHSGSENRILGVLLETEQPDQIKKLLAIISGDRFHAFFRFKSDEMNHFLRNLQDILVRVYAQDKSILEPVVDCVISFGLKRVDDEFRGMNMFFEKTNTYRPALEIYLKRPSENRRVYDFSDHISRDCFDYLIEARRAEIITSYELDSFISGLNYTGRYADAEELQKLSWNAFGAPDPAIKKTHDRYAKAALKKAENDIKYISSAEEFEKGIILFFKTFKKEKITFEELHDREARVTKFFHVASDFIVHFMHEVAEDREVSLTKCIEEIHDDIRFRVFRVKSLLNHSLGKKYTSAMLKMLQGYYTTTVKTFPFALINNESTYEEKVAANQYLKIWSKYQYDTPEDVLLEYVRINGEGLNFIRMAEVNKRDSVALQLVDYFETNNRISILKERILQNLERGLNNHLVLGTHIELCRKLHITAALPYILKVIYSDIRAFTNDYTILDIYAELGGDLSNLLNFYETIDNFEDYTFVHLSKLLSAKFPSEVIKRLSTALESSQTTNEKKLEIARNIAELGGKQGFQYIINKLDPQTETPYHTQSHWTIWNVETGWALTLLEPLLFTLVDDTLPKFRFYSSVDHLLLELLNGFAAKSEADLQLVTGLLNRKASEFATIYPAKHGQLIWYAQQMQESFRKTSTEEMPTTTLKKLLSKILE